MHLVFQRKTQLEIQPKLQLCNYHNARESSQLCTSDSLKRGQQRCLLMLLLNSYSRGNPGGRDFRNLSICRLESRATSANSPTVRNVAGAESDGLKPTARAFVGKSHFTIETDFFVPGIRSPRPAHCIESASAGPASSICTKDVEDVYLPIRCKCS